MPLGILPIGFRPDSRPMPKSDPTGVEPVAIDRPVRLITLLALIGAWLVPPAAGADEALDRALIEQLQIVVAGDDRPDLRRFEPGTLGSLFNADSQGFDPWREQIMRQLPPEAASLQPGLPIRRLVLEGCGPTIGRYGLAEREDLGFEYEEIDRIRINLALAASGLATEFSLEDSSGLRDFEGSGLRAFNTRLFRHYAKGRTDALYMVLDYSEGCGSEMFRGLAIRAPKGLHAVHVIPDFYLSVCAARYADPWNVSLCPWWNSAPVQVMGTALYHWQGRMPSGETRTGRVRIDLDEMNWDSGEVVLR